MTVERCIPDLDPASFQCQHGHAPCYSFDNRCYLVLEGNKDLFSAEAIDLGLWTACYMMYTDLVALKGSGDGVWDAGMTA